MSNAGETAYLGPEGMIFQNRQNDCGLAAMTMILNYHGILSLTASIENEWGLTRRGMSLMRLKEIGEHYGLRACGWKVDPKESPGTPMPAILFVDNRHFVVLDSVDREDRAFVRDPAIGRIRISGKMLRSRWQGEVLVFTKKELTTDGSRPDSLNKMQKEGITKHVK